MSTGQQPANLNPIRRCVVDVDEKDVDDDDSDVDDAVVIIFCRCFIRSGNRSSMVGCGDDDDDDDDVCRDAVVVIVVVIVVCLLCKYFRSLNRSIDFELIFNGGIAVVDRRLRFSAARFCNFATYFG